MQTNTKRELEEMNAAPKGFVTKWIPSEKVAEGKWKGGFGFVRLGGESVFVHTSVINLCDTEVVTKDFSRKTLVVYATEKTEKGPSATRAATLGWHEKHIAELQDKLRQQEEDRLLEERTRTEVEKFGEKSIEDFFEEIERDPKKCHDPYDEVSLTEGRYSLEAKIADTSVQVRSFENGLTVRISFTAIVSAASTTPRVFIGEVGRRRFSFLDTGLHYAAEIRKGNPLKDAVMALYKADGKKKEDDERQRQLEGVRRGLELVGIADLVDPAEVLKDCKNAGNSFPVLSQSYGEESPMIGALRWWRARRKALVEKILDDKAATFGVETVRRWVERSTWDSSYYARNDDSDNLYCGSGVGEYVGGGERTERHRWVSEIAQRVAEADNASGNRMDINPAVEEELLRHLRTEDNSELGRGDWAKEEKLFLPESRLRLARKRIADWIRLWRKEGPKNWGEWRKPPEVKDPPLAQKIEDLFLNLKERALVKQGVEKELARQAAIDSAEERRILDLAKVRKNWREMLLCTPRQLRSLHEEALGLMQRIRAAQNRAEGLAGPRKWEMRHQAEAEATARKAKEDARFMTGGAWSTLNDLKLNK